MEGDKLIPLFKDIAILSFLFVKLRVMFGSNSKRKSYTLFPLFSIWLLSSIDNTTFGFAFIILTLANLSLI